MFKSALLCVAAVVLIVALAIAMPISAMAASAETDGEKDREYAPTSEIKVIDGKEYVVTYDAVQDDDERDRKHRDHVHAGLFPLVNYKKHDDKKRTKFLYGPGMALVRGEESDTSKSLELVKLPGFRLLDVESHDDGRFDNKFLRLPILGSMFRHYKTDHKEKTRFLIFSHTKHFDDDGNRVKRRHRHRHHHSRGKHRHHARANSD